MAVPRETVVYRKLKRRVQQSPKTRNSGRSFIVTDVIQVLSEKDTNARIATTTIYVKDVLLMQQYIPVTISSNCSVQPMAFRV